MAWFSELSALPPPPPTPTGSVVERYTYTPFGTRTIYAPNATTLRPESSYNNPYGYTSRRHDDESGLMYFRARYYDSLTGEFLSRDPMEFVDGMSLYRGYFGLGGVDPYGLLRAVDDAWDVVGGIISLCCSPYSDKTQADIFGSGRPVNFWDKENAALWSLHHASCMYSDGNRFGYNLHLAWLAKTGSYTPTASDIDQVRRNTKAWFENKIQSHLNEYDGNSRSSYCNGLAKSCPEEIPVNISGNKGSDGTFVDDDFYNPVWGIYNFDGKQHANMFFAYGGYRFKMKGVARLAETSGGTCRYNVCVDITMEDTYAFASDWFLRRNPYYDAGRYLQDHDHAKGVYHKLTFNECYAWSLRW